MLIENRFNIVKEEKTHIKHKKKTSENKLIPGLSWPFLGNVHVVVKSEMRVETEHLLKAFDQCQKMPGKC